MRKIRKCIQRKTQGAGYKYGRFRGILGEGSLWEFCVNFMEISTYFSVGMGWVWELKSNSHGSPVIQTVIPAVYFLFAANQITAVYGQPRL